MKSAAWVLIAAMSALAQSDQQPRNDLPQPYRTLRDWAQLPSGLKWAAVTGVEPAPDGSVYVIHRCFANSCAGRSEPPILKFDKSGKLLKSWGEGMFVFPHGSCVDAQGNLWVTDAQGRNGKGHQVFKFSPDGKLLMTLGKAGVAGEGPDVFNQPTDVVVAPNGDIFVADGHRETGNNRIVKFSKDGKFSKTWGHKGTGPGEFHEPHTIALDSQGRVFVGDRVNNRIQIFDQDGKFLAEWKQFGRPSGIYIRDDILYVTDSQSSDKVNPPFKQGIRIGSVKDGKVTAFISAPDPKTEMPEGLAADKDGNIFGGFTNNMDLKKFVKN